MTNYSTEELIDYIRELEQSPYIVYIIYVRGTNSCGDSFSFATSTYKNASRLVSSENILEDVVKGIYSDYVEQRSNCCGGVEGCCGPVSDFKDWKEQFISIRVTPYGEQHLQKIKEDPNKTSNIYLGSIRSDYDDCDYEVLVHALKVE